MMSKACRDWKRGSCRYGSKCKYVHQPQFHPQGSGSTLNQANLALLPQYPYQRGTPSLRSDSSRRSSRHSVKSFTRVTKQVVVTGAPSSQYINLQLVIDMSGSMSRHIDLVKGAIYDIVSELSLKCKFHLRILVFNSSVKCLEANHTSGWGQWQKEQSKFMELIDETFVPSKCQGRTALYDAIMNSVQGCAAQRNFKKRQAENYPHRRNETQCFDTFVLTDGMDNNSTTTEADLVAELRHPGIANYRLVLVSADDKATAVLKQKIQKDIQHIQVVGSTCAADAIRKMKSIVIEKLITTTTTTTVVHEPFKLKILKKTHKIHIELSRL